ncbi:hypothetical protein Tco_1549420 [Tanacetum coccineum]
MEHKLPHVPKKLNLEIDNSACGLGRVDGTSYCLGVSCTINPMQETSLPANMNVMEKVNPITFTQTQNVGAFTSQMSNSSMQRTIGGNCIATSSFTLSESDIHNCSNVQCTINDDNTATPSCKIMLPHLIFIRGQCRQFNQQWQRAICFPSIKANLPLDRVNVPRRRPVPRFLQLYIYDTANEVKNRMAHFGGEYKGGLKKEIVEGLIEFLDNHNALV